MYNNSYNNHQVNSKEDYSYFNSCPSDVYNSEEQQRVPDQGFGYQNTIKDTFSGNDQYYYDHNDENQCKNYSQSSFYENQQYQNPPNDNN